MLFPCELAEGAWDTGHTAQALGAATVKAVAECPGGALRPPGTSYPSQASLGDADIVPRGQDHREGWEAPKAEETGGQVTFQS